MNNLFVLAVHLIACQLLGLPAELDRHVSEQKQNDCAGYVLSDQTAEKGHCVSALSFYLKVAKI